MNENFIYYNYTRLYGSDGRQQYQESIHAPCIKKKPFKIIMIKFTKLYILLYKLHYKLISINQYML